MSRNWLLCFFGFQQYFFRLWFTIYSMCHNSSRNESRMFKSNSTNFKFHHLGRSRNIYNIIQYNMGMRRNFTQVKINKKLRYRVSISHIFTRSQQGENFTTIQFKESGLLLIDSKTSSILIEGFTIKTENNYIFHLNSIRK